MVFPWVQAEGAVRLHRGPAARGSFPSYAFSAAPFLFYSVRTRIFPKSSSEYGNVITECAVLAIAASVLFYFALAWISVGVYLEIAAFHLIGYSSPTVIGLVNEKFLLPGGMAGWALNAVGTVVVIWRMRRPAIEWVD